MKIPKEGNQNPNTEEEQTTQWSNEKVQKDRQRSTKHTHKTKDRVTRTTLKICIHRFVATIVRKNKKDIRIELYVVVYWFLNK